MSKSRPVSAPDISRCEGGRFGYSDGFRQQTGDARLNLRHDSFAARMFRSAKRVKMRTDIHWIEVPAHKRLAIMARPRAGDWLDDEIKSWRTEGIDIVVSLLERDEIDELELGRESVLCGHSGVEYISFPIRDRGVPASRDKTLALAQSLADRMNDGKAVAIHCRAGIGRSSLVAACVLLCSGVAPDAAFKAIRNARGVSVPDTEEQRDWVTGFHQSLK